MIKRILVFTLAVALWAATSDAAFFDTAGEGIRPMSLGGAFTALSNDANAFWYNPGGLTRLAGGELGFTYAKLFPGIKDGGIGRSVLNFVSPLGQKGGIGFGFSRMGVDVSSEIVGAVGFGLSMGPKFSLGATAKLLRWSADGDVDPITGARDDDLSSSGFSLDVGLLYAQTGEWGTFGIGFVAKDFLQPNISQSGAEGGKLPAQIKGGIMYGRGGLLVALDMGRRSGTPTKLHMGAEYRLPETDLFLRAGGATALGAEEGSGGGDLDFGFGYSLQKWTVDYAYVYPTVFTDSPGSHFVSLGYRFMK